MLLRFTYKSVKGYFKNVYGCQILTDRKSLQFILIPHFTNENVCFVSDCSLHYLAGVCNNQTIK